METENELGDFDEYTQAELAEISQLIDLFQKHEDGESDVDLGGDDGGVKEQESDSEDNVLLAANMAANNMWLRHGRF